MVMLRLTEPEKVVGWELPESWSASLVQVSGGPSQKRGPTRIRQRRDATGGWWGGTPSGSPANSHYKFTAFTPQVFTGYKHVQNLFLL